MNVFLAEQVMMPKYHCVDINVQLVLTTHRQCLLVHYLSLTDTNINCYRQKAHLSQKNCILLRIASTPYMTISIPYSTVFQFGY